MGKKGGGNAGMRGDASDGRRESRARRCLFLPPHALVPSLPARMTIYPAIDIKGGRCVRLTQGRADQETVYAENPVDVAEEFKAAGSAWVHVVDLDGAFTGEPQNLAVVQAIAKTGLKVQLGGGLRTRAAIERALGFGVTRVVLGTRAVESETFVGELVQAFGEKIAVGIDAKNGQVAVD